MKLFIVCVFLSALHQSKAQSSNLNQTALIEQLLTGYEKTVRPKFGAEAVDVIATMYVLNIYEVSEHNNEMSLELYFRQQWEDSRLAYQGKTSLNIINLREETASRIWIPDTFITNGKSIAQSNDFTEHAFTKLYPDGKVFRSTRLSITAHCPMNMWNFPVSSQQCELVLESYGYTTADVKYSWKDDSAVGINSRISLPNYKFISHKFESGAFTMTQGSYGFLKIFFKFDRLSSRFITFLYLPSFFVVCLSIYSLWITVSQVRVIIGAVTLLAMFFLHSDANHVIPEAHSVNTRLDVYVFVCLLVVMLVLVLNLLPLLDAPCINPAVVQQNRRADDVELVPDPSTEFNNKGGAIECFGPLRNFNVERYLKLSLPAIFIVFNIIFLMV